jgi:hypothetical protein
MKTVTQLIWVAGIVQLMIASVNFFLPRRLRYAENLANVSTIVRQIFIVHSVYIVLVLTGLASLCIFFARELAGPSELGRCLSGFLAVFWMLRVGIQLFYYDTALKRENRLVHIFFTMAFVYLATVFTVAAIGG